MVHDPSTTLLVLVCRWQAAGQATRAPVLVYTSSDHTRVLMPLDTLLHARPIQVSHMRRTLPLHCCYDLLLDTPHLLTSASAYSSKSLTLLGSMLSSLLPVLPLAPPNSSCAARRSASSISLRQGQRGVPSNQDQVYAADARG